MVACFCDCYQSVGFDDFQVHISHRRLLESILQALGVQIDRTQAVVRAIDKRAKLTPDKYKSELLRSGLPADQLERLGRFVSLKGNWADVLAQTNQAFGAEEIVAACLRELKQIMVTLESFGKGPNCKLDFSLARGFDYYTGVLCECVPTHGVAYGSLGGGGRYDDLVSVFGGGALPAVGFSIGFDRLILALTDQQQRQSFDARSAYRTGPDYYVAVLGEFGLARSIEVASLLREHGIVAEMELNNRSLRSQLDHANRIQARYVVFPGEKESDGVLIRRRDMHAGKEEMVELGALIDSAMRRSGGKDR